MTNPASRSRRSVEAGFTLLEVLVALAIFALAALALLRLQATSLPQRRARPPPGARGGGRQSRHGMAHRSRAAGAGMAGGIVVNGGRRLAWQRVVRRDGPVWVAQITVRTLDAPQEASVARVVRAAP
jgi:general secretion pathway protein I